MAGEYSLTDLLERMYENQLALETAIMELVLWTEEYGALAIGENIRGSLYTLGENVGHIKQG